VIPIWPRFARSAPAEWLIHPQSGFLSDRAAADDFWVNGVTSNSGALARQWAPRTRPDRLAVVSALEAASIPPLPADTRTGDPCSTGRRHFRPRRGSASL